MDYKNFLFKDKMDLDENFLNLFPGCMTQGKMQKFIGNPLDVEYLSVKFSKVAIGTLKKYPNLKWIINRAHGVDNINLHDCKSVGVGVVCTAPTSTECSNYVSQAIENNQCKHPIVIFGNGSISKEIQKKFTTAKIIDSKTSKNEIINSIQNAGTIISTVPLNKKTINIYNDDFFSNMKDNSSFISISREETLNNKALLKHINRFNVAVIDTLSSELRNELINTKRVVYTNHTAWSVGYNKGSYNLKIKGVINLLLEGKLNGAILKNKTRRGFFQ